MALVFNNVTVPQSGNVIYNGTSLSVVKHGNTQVWKRAPEYLYNNGDTLLQSVCWATSKRPA